MEDNKDIKQAWEEALSKTSGAQFFRCALQVNPSSYNEYRGGAVTDEVVYNTSMVEKCMANQIAVVGLADHGSVQDSEKLREELMAAGITVFPGFEVCSAEKVQMVCLFPKDYTVERLNQILGAIQGSAVKESRKTTPSKNSVLQIAEIVFQEHGVWYAAHMEEDNGLLKLHQDGGGLTDTWKNEKLVLAGQIKGTIDELPFNYQQIVKNKDPNYARTNRVSVINAKDVNKPEVIDDPRASCWIKMSELSIEALKQAFLDGDSRIRLIAGDRKEQFHSRIRAVAFELGFLNDVRIHFNNNLNAIIGGRGSGKSTIIECIRYCLDLTPRSDDAKRNHDNIVENNLGNGRITMLVYSHQQGKEYVISRIYGEPLRITDRDGNISNLTVDEVLPGIELLGQNEILTLAEDHSRQVSLLLRFLPEKQANTEELIRSLKNNRLSLIAALEKREVAEGEVSELKKLEEQHKRFVELGIEEKLKLAEKYEREKIRLLKRIQDEVSGVLSRFDEFKEAAKVDLTFLSIDAIRDLPNQKLFSAFRETVENYLKQAVPQIEKIDSYHQSLSAAVADLKKQWEERQQHFQDDLMGIVSKLPDMAGRKGKQLGDEYLRIVKKISAIQSSEKQLKDQDRIVRELKKQREKLLAELDDITFRNYQQIESAIKRLNKNQLKGRLRITAKRGTNRNRMIAYFKELPGISAKRSEWINQPREVHVRTLVKQIEEGRDRLLQEHREYGLTDGIADTIAGLSKGKLMELEEILLEDEISIELNISEGKEDRYQPLDRLSTGQKCTAILHLLLLDNKDPLIIDQPEDNLDNAFIADRIVTELRKAKEERQFIISTHNANIPVFGDAEWIGALRAHEEQAVLSDDSVGSIDKNSVKLKVESILEGGKAAFEIRRLKYGF